MGKSLQKVGQIKSISITIPWMSQERCVVKLGNKYSEVQQLRNSNHVTKLKQQTNKLSGFGKFFKFWEKE